MTLILRGIHQVLLNKLLTKNQHQPTDIQFQLNHSSSQTPDDYTETRPPRPFISGSRVQALFVPLHFCKEKL